MNKDDAAKKVTEDMKDVFDMPRTILERMMHLLGNPKLQKIAKEGGTRSVINKERQKMKK